MSIIMVKGGEWKYHTEEELKSLTEKKKELKKIRMSARKSNNESMTDYNGGNFMLDLKLVFFSKCWILLLRKKRGGGGKGNKYRAPQPLVTVPNKNPGSWVDNFFFICVAKSLLMNPQ